MFSLVFRERTLQDARKFAVRIGRGAGGVSSASHLPREHWLTVRRGLEVSRPGRSLRQVTRRGGVSRRVKWIVELSILTSNISRPGRSLHQVEAEHRYNICTLQLGFAPDFFLRVFLGLCDSQSWCLSESNISRSGRSDS